MCFPISRAIGDAKVQIAKIHVCILRPNKHKLANAIDEESIEDGNLNVASRIRSKDDGAVNREASPPTVYTL